MTTEQIASTLLEIADFLKSQNDPYAELKAAHKAGKVIQSFNHERGIWQDCPSPAFEGGTAYRIKPEAKPFQLPPPPPGMRWHREDGWEEGDLPQGWRPLTHGEIVQKNDEVKNANLDGDCFIAALGSIGWEVGYTHKNQYCRTRRPLIFTHAGKQWTWHRPGDPMPCDGEARIEIICEGGKTVDLNGDPLFPRRARVNMWEKTLGWRYADETKTVRLGPEDVMPFTVIRRKGETETWHWRTVSYVDAVKVTCGNRGYEWDELASDYERNESLPLTGKWNPDAWEPCHKPA